MMSCEYLVTKKTLRNKTLSASARNSLYQLIIAQMALRTVRAVFAADRGRLTRTVACNGYVDTTNTATGKDARWCLVSVRVTRELFDELDLARVKPLDCLAYLHAKISRTRRSACQSSRSLNTHGTIRPIQPNSIPSPALIPSRIFSTLTATNSRS